MESFVGSFTPQRRGNAVFRNFNPHQWTGPVAPRVTRALILRLRLESLESGEDIREGMRFLLARVVSVTYQS